MHLKDLSMGSTIELIFKLLAFKKLLAYPQWTIGVPPGVRVPQVENRWTRRHVCVFFCWSFNRSVVSLSICMSLSRVLSVCVPARLFVCLNYFFFIIFFFSLLASQYYKLMTLSLLSKIGEMRASKKCSPGLGCRIEPRSSRTGALCPTDAPLHIHNNFLFLFFCFTILF